jgi:small-conductance mechanosensitive channel
MDAELRDTSAWLTWEFWTAIVRQTVTWAVTSLPKVLVVLLLALVLLKIVAFASERLTKTALKDTADENWAEAAEHRKRVETLIGIVRRVAVIAVWVLAAVLVLMQVGVNVAPIIAGAGVIGLAVGFGAQELVRDIISGFFNLIENHVRKGDVAIINGTGGLVENIGLRTIVLRDLSGVVHIFQNGKIQTLANMTKTWSAMVFDIAVSHKEDPDAVVEIMREVGETLRNDVQLGPKILEPMEIFGVEAIGDNGVVIKARIKTVPIEQWTVGREYWRRLKRAFEQQHIEFGFPQRVLQIERKAGTSYAGVNE